MFGASFQRKYALTDQGVQNTKKGTFWTVDLLIPNCFAALRTVEPVSATYSPSAMALSSGFPFIQAHLPT